MIPPANGQRSWTGRAAKSARSLLFARPWVWETAIESNLSALKGASYSVQLIPHWAGPTPAQSVLLFGQNVDIDGMHVVMEIQFVRQAFRGEKLFDFRTDGMGSGHPEQLAFVEDRAWR